MTGPRSIDEHSDEEPSWSVSYKNEKLNPVWAEKYQKLQAVTAAPHEGTWRAEMGQSKGIWKTPTWPPHKQLIFSYNKQYTFILLIFSELHISKYTWADAHLELFNCLIFFW